MRISWRNRPGENVQNHTRTFQDFKQLDNQASANCERLPFLSLSKGRSEKEGGLEAGETLGIQPSGKESSSGLSFAQDQDETHQRGRTAIILNGPPVPPAIFMGSAITSKPCSGRPCRSARFSKTGTLWESNVTCDSNVVDWP